jgi:biopolymer transport protein ExbB
MIARWIPELRTRLKFSVSFRPAFNECLRNRPTFTWHDFSLWSLFFNADTIVKAVMLGLILASIVTWTVGLAKALQLRAASQRLKLALDQVRRHADTLSRIETDAAQTPLAAFASAALQESALSQGLPADGIKERLAAQLGRVEAAAGRQMNRGTGMLATIGSTAPFVGLFGTVWGIMNSFVGISKLQASSFAVVAPGIAEALLATALGLFAAIPAVVIYNLFARAVAGYRALLAQGATDILNLVSRELDRSHAP